MGEVNNPAKDCAIGMNASDPKYSINPTETNTLRTATAQSRCGRMVPKPSIDNTPINGTAMIARTVRNCQTLISVAMIAT
jgi:hypothetical protein